MPPVRVLPRPVGCAIAFAAENLGETGWLTTLSGVEGSSPPTRFDCITLDFGERKTFEDGQGWCHDDDDDGNDVLPFAHFPGA